MPRLVVNVQITTLAPISTNADQSCKEPNPGRLVVLDEAMVAVEEMLG